MVAGSSKARCWMRARARGRADGGGGFGDELRGELGDGLGDGGLADDEELMRFPAGFGEELVAGEEGFAEAEAVGVEAGVELAAAGVEEGVDLASCRAPIAMRLRWMGHPGGRLGEAGEDGEAGDGDQREVEGVAEALGGAEADALSGEGAGAVDDGYGVEQCKAEAEPASEGVDGWDEALGGGAAGEGLRRRARGLASARAMLPVAPQVSMSRIFKRCDLVRREWKARRTPVQVRAIGKPNPIRL